MYLASVQKARHKQHQQQKKNWEEKANVALKLNEVNFFNIIFSAHSAFINCLMLCRLPLGVHIQFRNERQKTTAERNVATVYGVWEYTTTAFNFVGRANSKSIEVEEINKYFFYNKCNKCYCKWQRQTAVNKRCFL